jgi:tetratricopeptide (TPR) repeat protein
MKIMLVLLLCATGWVSYGCATVFYTEYYLFSGKIVDAETGKGIPRAALYIGESADDFFKPPRIYKDDVPSYNADASAHRFNRDRANRFLFLAADDSGAFTTVWRRDVIRTFFVLWPFGGNKLPSISFCVGARGYSDQVVSFASTADGEAFADSGSVVDMKENPLPPISLQEGLRGVKTPAPVQAAILRTRYPPAPRGKAGDLFAQGEAAFGEKDYEGALRYYAEALKLAPGDPTILIGRVDALYWLFRFKEVLTEGSRYVARYPHVGFVQTILADAAFHLGDQETNREYLIRAMQLEPEFKGSYEKLCALDPRFAEMPEGWPPPEKIWE